MYQANSCLVSRETAEPENGTFRTVCCICSGTCGMTLTLENGNKEFSGYIERFSNLYGTPNFSTCGSHCFEAKSMANVHTYGAMPIADYENSKCIVLWGKNPFSSTPSLVKEIKGARARG